MVINEGSKAPSFNLKDKDGESFSLKNISSDFVVIYFYPKDNTPGCTTETIGFNRDLKKFAKLNTTVIGISGGDEKTKTKFCTKHDLELLLLSDSDFSVAKSYDSYGERSFMGRKFNGIYRKTFVLDKDRNIIKIYDKVKPEIHSGEVLEFISSR